jgi:hypothetical protein
MRDRRIPLRTFRRAVARRPAPGYPRRLRLGGGVQSGVHGQVWSGILQSAPESQPSNDSARRLLQNDRVGGTGRSGTGFLNILSAGVGRRGTPIRAARSTTGYRRDSRYSPRRRTSCLSRRGFNRRTAPADTAHPARRRTALRLPRTRTELIARAERLSILCGPAPNSSRIPNGSPSSADAHRTHRACRTALHPLRTPARPRTAPNRSPSPADAHRTHRARRAAPSPAAGRGAGKLTACATAHRTRSSSSPHTHRRAAPRGRM